MKIDSYDKQNIDTEYEYDGVPQNMVLNKDNTTTILMEDLIHITKKSGMYDSVGHMNHAQVTTLKTELDPVGISELSDAGEELNGYAINKKQQAEGNLPILCMAGRSKGGF